jgi:hypothetical protein
VVGSGAATRLRIATGRHGDELFPTDAEAAQAEAEAERREKEAALRRIAELELELARSR